MKVSRRNGFLTEEDLMLLKTSSERVLKYKKKYVEEWTCNSCKYKWFYKSIKCPSCMSVKINLN